jgi:hypothetical protein
VINKGRREHKFLENVKKRIVIGGVVYERGNELEDIYSVVAITVE